MPLSIWTKTTARQRLIAAAVGVVAVALVTVHAVTTSAHKASLLVVGDQETRLDVEDFEPFGENTLTQPLGSNSTLRFASDLPRLDGATALYPLYASFARAAYPANRYDPDETPNASPVVCSRTSSAISRVARFEADVAFVMGLSREEREEASAMGSTLSQTPIGSEAFVFFVSSRNPVSNLSALDVRRIYSGQVTNWRDVGGPDRRIDAYQRNGESGSQVAFREIMSGWDVMDPPREVSSMGGMADEVLDYRNSATAIGFSFRYYLESMIRSDELKILSIDGVAPTKESIASGEYPFAVDFVAVTAKPVDPEDEAEQRETHPERIANTARLIDWILSPQGQSLVEKVGYVPIVPAG
jgi:phosphate transport system substrate-binding protein